MSSHSSHTDVRPVLQRVASLIGDRPDLQQRYGRAKRIVRAFRRPAFYEISQRCNLRCEGCYYFEGGLQEPVIEEPSIARWKEFFAAEGARNVTMAYFVGAEPALEQERLLAAAGRFPYGNIGTNGTIRIDPAIPFRIGVSVWAADDATDRTLRGAVAFRKALKNYRGDPRVNILYTLSRWNLDNLQTVAEMCRDNGLPLTFNLYSPTQTFLDKVLRGEANDKAFFRNSGQGHTPMLSDDDLQNVRRAVDALMDKFPDTVLYSRAYNEWVTQAGSLFDVEPETGIARDCGSRIVGTMRYYRTDGSRAFPKCCTSDIDCSQCRMYSGGWSTKFRPSWRDLASEDAFSSWLDMIDVLGRIFLYEPKSEAKGAFHSDTTDLDTTDLDAVA